MAEAVAASPVVVVCVLDHRAVGEVPDPVAGALAGRAVVNLTNGTPSEARETARRADRHGVRYLDGGIMAVPPMIGETGGFVLCSGSREVFEEHAETLAGLAVPKYVGEDPAAASLQDLALLTAMCGMVGGLLAERHGRGPAGDGPGRRLGGPLGDRRDPGDAGRRLRQPGPGQPRPGGQHRAAGADAGAAGPRARAAGLGGGDISALADLLRAPEGEPLSPV